MCHNRLYLHTSILAVLVQVLTRLDNFSSGIGVVFFLTGLSGSILLQICKLTSILARRCWHIGKKFLHAITISYKCFIYVFVFRSSGSTPERQAIPLMDYVLNVVSSIGC